MSKAERVLAIAVIVFWGAGMWSTIKWARLEGAVSECHAQYSAQVESIRARIEQQTATVDSLLRAIDNRQKYYSLGGK